MYRAVLFVMVSVVLSALMLMAEITFVGSETSI